MSGAWDILAEICENPGWTPDGSANAERAVDELLAKGWIVGRRGGYEATPLALERYPHFDVPERAPKPTTIDPREPLPFHRIVVLLRGLLEDMPVGHLALRCAAVQGQYADGMEWEIARRLAETLR